MPNSDFSNLHRKSIAVGIRVGEKQILVKGSGAVTDDPTVGRCLRILVKDAAANFEIILKESEWRGDILPGAALGCDYHIALENEPSAIPG